MDPVFLLTEKDFVPLMNEHPLIKNDFILLYSIHFHEGILKAAKKLAREKGLPVYVLYTGRKALKSLKYRFQVMFDSGPASFLFYLHSASFVLTDSFHATAFSIIFSKKFFCYQDSKIENGVTDDRLLTLLNDAHLTSCFIFSDYQDFSNQTNNSFGLENLQDRINESKKWLSEEIKIHDIVDK